MMTDDRRHLSFNVSRRTLLASTFALTAVPLVSRMANAAQQPFRIGALNAITGGGGAFGTGIQKTIIELAKQINDIGAPAGRELTVFAEDSQTLPEPALLAARKLVQVNKCDAIVGVHTSAEALAIIPFTNEANVILIDWGAAPALLTQNTKGLRYSFYPSSRQVGAALAEMVKREGFTKPASLYLANESQIANANAFAENWKAAGGKTPSEVRYQPNQPNYRSEIQTTLNADPDVIVLNGFEPDATIIVRQLYELGSTAKIIAPEFAITERLMKAVGKELVEGILVYRLVPSKGSPAYKNFEDTYKKAMNLPVDAITTGATNAYGTMAYDAVTLLALAIEYAGPNASNADIASAVRQVCGPGGTVVSSYKEGRELAKAKQAINYEGASGPIDYDKNGTPVGNFGLTVMTDGKYVERYTVTPK